MNLFHIFLQVDIASLYIVRHKVLDTSWVNVLGFFSVFQSSLWLGFIGVLFVAVVCSCLLDEAVFTSMWRPVHILQRESWALMALTLNQGPPLANCCSCGRRFGEPDCSESTEFPISGRILRLMLVFTVLHFYSLYQGKEIGDSDMVF